MTMSNCPKCGTYDVLMANSVGDIYFACGYSYRDGVESSECGWSTKQKPDKTVCTCSIPDLMIRGCRCGQFQKDCEK